MEHLLGLKHNFTQQNLRYSLRYPYHYTNILYTDTIAYGVFMNFVMVQSCVVLGPSHIIYWCLEKWAICADRNRDLTILLASTSTYHSCAQGSDKRSIKKNYNTLNVWLIHSIHLCKSYTIFSLRLHFNVVNPVMHVIWLHMMQHYLQCLV